MIAFVTGVDENVINLDYDEHVQVPLEHLVHQVHKGYWGICETKGHALKLEMSIVGSESCFKNVIFSESELMKAGSEVYLRKITSTLKLVEQVIDFGKIEIGWASGRRSILKLISLLGGTQRRSLGNTFGISITAKTDSRLGVS
ncbi:hypothetical protein BC332_07406 [Capsicum chinense]|nr:hypothetical protein BC332_07406 [Capsicum chinense]